jgi:O-antigen ligase
MPNYSNTAFIILAFAILSLPLSMTLSGIFLLVLLIKTLKDKLTDKEKPVPENIKKIWLLFIIYSLFQGIFAIKPLFHYGGLIGHYLLYWLIFYLICQTVKTSGQLKKIIEVVAYSGTLISFIGIIAWAGFHFNLKLFYVPLYGGDYLINLQLGEYINKASGFSMNPNNLGSFLLLSIFMSLSLFDDSGATKEKQKLYLVLIFLQSTCLILTGSRGAIIALVSGILLYLIFRSGSRKILIPLAFSFILILIINFPVFSHLFSTITDPTYSSNSLRISVWKISLAIIRDFPQGVGILNYENIYLYYLPAQAKYLAHAHNWYLQTFIESGILGGLLFFTFFFLLIFYLWKNLKGSYFNIVIALITFSIFNLSDYVLTDTRICVLLTIVVFTGLKLINLPDKKIVE